MFRKNWLPLTLLCLVLGLALVFGCSSDDDPVDPGGGDDPGLQDVGSISGTVNQAAGIPLAGVAVTTGSQSTTTNEDGYFVLTAVSEGSMLVAFAFDGYMSTFRMADVREGDATHFANVTLLPVESGTVGGVAGGQVSTSDGDGSVTFGGNSFVDGAGNPYEGDVTVEINAMLPEDNDFYGTFPGDFVGVREDGSEVPFVSYGFMNVDLLGSDKAPLELADGSTAALYLTISADKAATAPASIPMWYFDETDGQWHEEGEATLSGNVYSANVAHFSTWNWDLPVSDICSITGIVIDENERPLADVRVLSRAVDAAIMADTYTAGDGTFTVQALKNSLTDVWAVSGSRTSEVVRVTVLEECPVVLELAIVLDVPAYTISLTWGATPSDLDTHVLIPSPWVEEYTHAHIAYYNYGSYETDPYATLDTDDTSSYGPEIVTGTRFYEGRYQYWVHNFSANVSSGIQASGAVVQLEAPGGLWVFPAADVSLDGDTTGWWHVFDMVVSPTGATQIESVQQFQPRFSSDGVFPAKSGKSAK